MRAKLRQACLLLMVAGAAACSSKGNRSDAGGSANDGGSSSDAPSSSHDGGGASDAPSSSHDGGGGTAAASPDDQKIDVARLHAILKAMVVARGGGAKELTEAKESFASVTTGDELMV